MAISDEQINYINLNRLRKWGNKLRDDHATALILVGIGHDHKKGKTFFCTAEDLPDGELYIWINSLPRLFDEYMESRRGHSARTP